MVLRSVCANHIDKSDVEVYTAAWWNIPFSLECEPRHDVSKEYGSLNCKGQGVQQDMSYLALKDEGNAIFRNVAKPLTQLLRIISQKT